jgi:ATP-dependent Lon protease
MESSNARSAFRRGDSGAICRHAAMRIAEGNATAVVITVADLHAILGPKRFEPEIAMRTSVPGVATGNHWRGEGWVYQLMILGGVTAVEKVGSISLSARPVAPNA